MKRNSRAVVIVGKMAPLCLGALTVLGPSAHGADSAERLVPVPIGQVAITNDTFWEPKLKTWRNVTIGHCLDNFEARGVFENFDNVRDGKLKQKYNGSPWFDGLVYEMIRACGDFLAAKPDEALERRLDGYIQRIVAAQARDPDGYLNTYTQMERPTQRWGTNGGDEKFQHDVYNSGALIEAGVHYYRATGKLPLLKAGVRIANHMCDVMGPAPKRNIIPGHSGPEECLVLLYALFRDQPGLKREMGFAVEEQRYLKLAEWFIEGRGNYEGRSSFKEYCQDHQPVFEQETIEGHAVRATLMGAGLAAIAVANNRPEYSDAAKRLWENMVYRRLYITGGVGALAKQEAFGADYELPNDGYLETCAAVGNGFYSRNMNLAFGEARYADELERVLYNGALCGVSLCGNTFTYVNPLEFKRGHARWSWSGCPCCPPMFLKLMGALPGYIYAQDAQENLYVNLFVGSRAAVKVRGQDVVVTQQGNYPWDIRRTFTVTCAEKTRFDLCIRVPGWCQGATTDSDLYDLQGRRETGVFTVAVNGAPVPSVPITNGYARLSRDWNKGDRVELVMPMPVRRVTSTKIPATQGKVALQRGPVVYALELLDHPGVARDFYLPNDAELTTKWEPDLFGGMMTVKAGLRQSGKNESLAGDNVPLIPYFAYLNRGPSELVVWLPERVKENHSEAARGEPKVAK